MARLKQMTTVTAIKKFSSKTEEINTCYEKQFLHSFPNKPWPHDYKSFFMLNSAEHEISMLDKSHLINLLEELLIYRKFHCFCLSNETFKFELSYTLYHQ